MKKLLLLTAFLGMFTAAGAQEVTFECIGGTSFGEPEGCQKAFDNDLTTKWGMYSGGDKFAVVECSEPIYLTGYTMVNANDNTQYNRDIKEWEIWGTNDPEIADTCQTKTDGWERMVDVRENKIVSNKDRKASYFGINNLQKAYKYLMFKRVVASATQSQFSEISFSYTKQPPLKEGIAYKVIEEGTTAGTGSQEEFKMVFDDHLGTKYCGRKSESETVWTLNFEASEAISPVGYYFTTGGDAPTRDPKSWVIYGSTDEGLTWEVIDTKEGQEFPSERMEYKEFSMTQPATAYKFFKIEFSETHGSDLLQFGEFGFHLTERDFSQNTQVLCYSGKGNEYDHERTPNLFDGNFKTKRCGSTNNYSTVFGVGRPVILHGYGLQMADEWGSYDRRPKDWTIEGSNDGVTWEMIDQVRDDDKLAAETDYPSLFLAYYMLPEPTKAYKYFRFTLDATQGASLFQLAELIPLFQKNDVLNNLTIVDGTVPSINGVANVKNLKYERTGDATLGTVVAPFTMNSSSDMTLYTLDGFTDNTLEFNSVDVLAPNTPALFRHEEAKPFSFEGAATIVPSAEATTSYEGLSFVGVTGETVNLDEVRETAPGTYYALYPSLNAFVKAGSNVSCGTMRAYLLHNASAASKLMLTLDDETLTAIENVEKDESSDSEPLYNLQGMRVNAQYKGIVVKNGRKMLRK